MIELLQTTASYFISPLFLIREVYLRQEWFYLLKGRSSRPEVFCKKGFLENIAKFTGKHLCQGLFFNKVWNFIKKETLEQVFSCVLCEIFKNTLFIENLRWNKTMCLRKIWDWKPLKKQQWALSKSYLFLYKNVLTHNIFWKKEVIYF